MINFVVPPGDTLSQIAERYGSSIDAIASVNHIANINIIYAGQTLVIPQGGSFSSWTPSSSSLPESDSGSSSSSPSSAATPSQAGSSAGGYSIPGMPSSLANCIAFRESTNGQASSNVFQIMPSSGYSVAGDSLAQQEQVAGQLYAQYGGSPWSSDGCPGT